MTTDNDVDNVDEDGHAALISMMTADAEHTRYTYRDVSIEHTKRIKK